MVRTPASQAGNAGSIPVICSRLIYGYSSMVEPTVSKTVDEGSTPSVRAIWPRSSVGREKNASSSYVTGSNPVGVLKTVHCHCGLDMLRFSWFSRIRQSSLPAWAFKLKSSTESMSLYIIKTGDGGSLHTARSSEVRAIFEQCDALARIGCDVVLFILFNISAIGVVPICCFRVSLPLLNHMRSMTMSLNRIGLSKPKASGSS